MTQDLAYLLNLLEDEFSKFEGVRVRILSKSGTRKSPDLPQDYDPETHSVHLDSGVLVQTKRKQYFFPEGWMRQGTRWNIQNQIQEIRDLLG